MEHTTLIITNKNKTFCISLRSYDITTTNYIDCLTSYGRSIHVQCTLYRQRSHSIECPSIKLPNENI